jgi:hypothetical protein
VYRHLCGDPVCAGLLAWEPAPGDFFFVDGTPAAPLQLVPDGGDRHPTPAGARFYPRLDQLKIRCQRRLVCSWRLAQERFEQWVVEQGFFETEEEAWLRFLGHLHEAELPSPCHDDGQPTVAG